jgi:AraC-like DNA-binding protein
MPKTPEAAVQLKECWHVLQADPWIINPHYHDAQELSLVIHGELRTTLGERLLIGRPGEVLIYPRGMVHRPVSTAGVAPELLIMQWIGGEDLCQVREPEVRRDRRGRLRRQLEWILELHPSDQADQRAVVASLAHTVVHELGRLADPGSQDLGERIRRYIRENLSRRVTLDELAAEAGLSKYHFARTFKQATGQTPMQMLGQLRVETARSLIIQTDMPLDAIAGRVGLADASHLWHLFRRQLGRSPGSFRDPTGEPEPATAEAAR